MSDDDRIRSLMRSADADMPVGRAVSWEATMHSARRKRGLMWAATAVGAAALIAIGFWVGASTLGDDDPNLRPAAPTATDQPTEESTPGSTPAPPRNCSAGAISGPAVEMQQGLPERVVQTRTAIATLALACDFEALEHLALQGNAGFSFSFGGETSPSAFWKKLENNRRLPHSSRAVTLAMVQMLNLPYCVSVEGREVIYSWPSAHCEDRTEADWDAVRPFYGHESIDQMQELGLYFGYRHGITDDGDWIYFVAGD